MAKRPSVETYLELPFEEGKTALFKAHLGDFLRRAKLLGVMRNGLVVPDPLSKPGPNQLVHDVRLLTLDALRGKGWDILPIERRKRVFSAQPFPLPAGERSFPTMVSQGVEYVITLGQGGFVNVTALPHDIFDLVDHQGTLRSTDGSYEGVRPTIGLCPWEIQGDRIVFGESESVPNGHFSVVQCASTIED